MDNTQTFSGRSLSKATTTWGTALAIWSSFFGPSRYLQTAWKREPNRQTEALGLYMFPETVLSSAVWFSTTGGGGISSELTKTHEGSKSLPDLDLQSRQIDWKDADRFAASMATTKKKRFDHSVCSHKKKVSGKNAVVSK